MKLAVAVALTIGLTSTTAFAGTITFTLANPNQSVSSVSGGTLTYAATVSAAAGNSGAVFLNGDSFNVTAPVTVNDNDFFADFPLSLAPGTSFTGNLFTLTIPPNAPIGTFLGTFTLLGGANGNASDTLGTVNFSAATTTPEPSSLMMLLAGTAVLAMSLLWRGFQGTLRSRVR